MRAKLFAVSGSDAFFAFQIAMAYYFAIPQLFRMFENVQGVTINWLLCADLFIILNLFLTIGTYRKDRSREKLQTVLIYANWVVLVTPMVIISFFRYTWTESDTLVGLLIFASVMLVLLWGRYRNRGLGDSVIRGLLVGLFRVVPHLYLAFCIIQAGNGCGIAAKTILAANVTASARIVTLVLSGYKSGWEKGLVASLLSEAANESSWMIVTLVWLFFSSACP